MNDPRVALCTPLLDLGFARRDVARLMRITVAATRTPKTPEDAEDIGLAAIVRRATLDAIADSCRIDDIAAWCETRIHPDAPVTPLDLYCEQRLDLFLLHAQQRATPEDILDRYDPGWRDRFASDWEVFTAADGDLAIRQREPGDGDG